MYSTSVGRHLSFILHSELSHCVTEENDKSFDVKQKQASLRSTVRPPVNF